MGTPEFAVPSLEALLAVHEVVAVYTRPDAASGRGSTLRPTPVKSAAVAADVTVLQPPTLRDPAVIAQVASHGADVIIVAAYGLILPLGVLEAAVHGAVNVHASLLPRWRGAAPIERAILAGDQITGVSIMRMEEGLDTGPYCVQLSTSVADKTAIELSTELASLGASALLEALRHIEAGTCVWQPQQEAGVTYAAKLEKPELLLDPTLQAEQALRRVRASSRHAPARAVLAGHEVVVTEATRVSGGPAQGCMAVDRDGVLLGFSDGALKVTALRPQGRTDTEAVAWARGARLASGATWEGVS